jgi:hypothetical protein
VIRDVWNDFESTLELATTLPLSWTRSAVEKNLITSLSSIDPQKALGRLQWLTPAPNGMDRLAAEDLRAYAAKTIFLAAFKSGTSIPELLDASVKLASDGDFPFDALGRVLAVAESQSSADDIQLAAFQAASHYKDSPYAANVDTEYVAFIKQLSPKVTSGIRSVIVEPLLSQLEAAAMDSDDSSLTKLVAIGPRVRLNKAMASRLVASLDFTKVQLPQTQFERWEKLKSALAVTDYGREPLGEVAVDSRSKPNSESLNRASAIVRERGEVRWIQQNLDAEPDLLFRRLSRISTPGLRYDAISSILQKLKPDSEHAQDLKAQLMQIEKSDIAPEARLKILMRKLRTMQECESAQRAGLVRSLLDLGNELFAISYDASLARPAYDHLGFSETTEAIEQEAGCSPGRGLTAANSLAHPVLRAYAIVSAVAASRKAN